MKTLLEQAKAKGTDKAYREWVQKQPSALSNRFSEYLEDGTGRCIAAHWRHNTGIATKPEYQCIPLTNEEHMRAHQKGDSEIGTEEWWEEAVNHYIERWLDS